MFVPIYVYGILLAAPAVLLVARKATRLIESKSQNSYIWNEMTRILE